MQILGSGILQIMQQNIFMANQLSFSQFECAEMRISYWETLADHRKTCKGCARRDCTLGRLKMGTNSKKENRHKPPVLGHGVHKLKVLFCLTLNYSLQWLLPCAELHCINCLL